MQPLILCIHMEKSRMMRLSLLALGLGIAVREVPDSDWGQTLGALCGLEPRKTPAPAGRAPEEMLVMAHFPDALMDRFLSAFRQSGLSPVRLKAVLTPYNRDWTCGQLFLMLSQEAASLPRHDTRD